MNSYTVLCIYSWTSSFVCAYKYFFILNEGRVAREGVKKIDFLAENPLSGGGGGVVPPEG